MKINTNQTQSGERLTFFQLFQEKKYEIEIPIIQRDYAQGRDSSLEVRNTFLNAIYSYLEENTKNRDLDFIYGSLLNEVDKTEIKFIPLDGQQRLTTLFLLHWYLANQCGKMDHFKDAIFKDNKESKFTYETRTSSREFCDALLLNDLDLSSLLDDNLSLTIRDKNWYFLSWENDPTIKSMLVMLDAIHLKFKNTTGFYDRLTSLLNPVITFHFLNLKEFKLTDDLYIKMNSRGKPLTSFENFKAKFEQLIKNINFSKASSYKLKFQEIEKDVTIQEYFSYKIDTEWAYLFWSYCKDNQNLIFDELIMNFIRAMAINHYASTSNDSNIINNLKLLINKNIESLTFQQYMDIKCFGEKFIIDIIGILDLFKNGDSQARRYLQDYFYYHEDSLFKKAIENKFDNFTQRVQFFAFCQYLLFNKSTDGLKSWMRFIHNLSENTIYDGEEEFIRSMRSIIYLLPISENFNEKIIINVTIDGFNRQQVQEETIKAILIEKGDNWKNSLYEIEQHNFFRGQISFALSFCGIQNYYSENLNCNWSEDEDKLFYDSFNNYSRKGRIIFDQDGLKFFKNYIWERALLIKGDYLLKESRNVSYLINGIDRDISWKRLLRGGSDKNEDYFENKRNYIKEIFDDPDFEISDLESSLEKIILKGSKNIHDWRRKIIDTPNLLSYVGAKRYMRFNSEDNIYLLSKEKMSGRHVEFYSYSIYLKILEKNYDPFKNIYYFEVSGEEEEPCIVIDKWVYNESNFGICIYFSGQHNQYKLWFFDRNKKPFDPPIVQILLNNGFNLITPENHYFLFLSENEIEDKLVAIVKEIKSLIL